MNKFMKIGIFFLFGGGTMTALEFAIHVLPIALITVGCGVFLVLTNLQKPKESLQSV